MATKAIQIMKQVQADRSVQRARELLMRTTPTPKTYAPETAPQRYVARPWEGGHSIAWLSWLGGTLLLVGQLENPLYLVLVWAICVLIWSTCAGNGPLGRSIRLFLWLGAWIFGLHLCFSIFTVSLLRGQTILWTMPVWQLPALLGGLHIGGIVSLEQIVYGAVRGLRIWTLLMVFGTFNACVNHYRLLRRAPGFLMHVGLIITIGLAFVPQTILKLKAIREAQRLRGHRFRSWRDALPLLVPLLSGGLERALMLAEAMEARGYGRIAQPTTTDQRSSFYQRWSIVRALVFLLIGCTGLLSGVTIYQGIGAGLAATGTAIILWNWRTLSTQRTTYIREHWTWHSSMVVGAVWAGALLLIFLQHQGYDLAYRIFPKLSYPRFDPVILLPLLCVSLPVWVWPKQASRAAD